MLDKLWKVLAVSIKKESNRLEAKLGMPHEQQIQDVLLSARAWILPMTYVGLYSLCDTRF